MSRASNGLRPAVFLDRDGVLNSIRVENGLPVGPRPADAVQVLPGVAEACRALRDAGYL